MSDWCTHCERVVEGDICELCGESTALQERPPIPLRWKAFGVLSVIYLVWRGYQIVSWLTH